MRSIVLTKKVFEMNFYKLDWIVLMDELRSDLPIVTLIIVLGLFKLTLRLMIK